MTTHVQDKPLTLTPNSTDDKASQDQGQYPYQLELENEKQPDSQLASRASRPSRSPSRTEVEEALDEGVAAEHRDSPELPNGGYGWVVVICVLALNACTWGINTTYGVFTAYFLQYNYYGATQLQYAFVGGLSAAMAVLQGPFANFLTRKFGYKVPLIVGAVLCALGQCLSGITRSFGAFIATQAVVFGIGMGLILVPSQPLVAHWFDKRLSLAQGIAQAGSGVGALIFSNTTPVLLHSVGVQWTYVINGCISAFVLIVASILVRGRHEAVQAQQVPMQLNYFWHPGYKWLLIWAFLTMMGYFIAIYTLASYCTGALGMTQVQGGAVQSIVAAGQLVGRPVWGFLMDYAGRTNMVILSYLICGVATLAAWMPGRSFGVMAFYGFVNGACSGTIHSATAPLTAAVVGISDLASALSIYWLTLSIPNLMGQPFAIMIVDYSRTHLGRSGPGEYEIAIGFCAGLYLAAAIALYGVKHYLQGNWKIWQKA